MPILANARYERFAQIVANGKLTPTAAYREALGADARDADVNSCRWMKKPPIAKRIAELKAKAAGNLVLVSKAPSNVASNVHCPPLRR
jgi:phage terminase small subunit